MNGRKIPRLSEDSQLLLRADTSTCCWRPNVHTHTRSSTCQDINSRCVMDNTSLSSLWTLLFFSRGIPRRAEKPEVLRKSALWKKTCRSPVWPPGFSIHCLMRMILKVCFYLLSSCHLFQAKTTALTVSHPVMEITKVGDNGPDSPGIAHALFNLTFE